VPINSEEDDMETTPAPEKREEEKEEEEKKDEEEEEGEEEEERPTPPPHRTKISLEDAEKFKTEGNKYYKAGKYTAAIGEYSKGMCSLP
jgi:DnaJ family protein C protein 7